MKLDYLWILCFLPVTVALIGSQCTSTQFTYSRTIKHSSRFPKTVFKSVAPFVPHVNSAIESSDNLKLAESATPTISRFSNLLLNANFDQYQRIFKAVFNAMISQLSHIMGIYTPESALTAESIANNISINPFATIVGFLVVILGISKTKKSAESPYDAQSSAYDVKKADDFYRSRPLLVGQRLIKLIGLTGAFVVKLGLDWRMGTLEQNESRRAKEVLDLTTQLGPTFVKLGQALSIRTDLLPPAYASELRKLQDSVKPFDSAVARQIMLEEMGIKDLNEVFLSISDVPVASASIGQVYKGILKDGREVAVKVQRPAVLGQIALDLHVLRLLTPIQVMIKSIISRQKTSQADIESSLALVDEWGRGFVAEVDYRLEAKNTKEFAETMARKGLDAVTSPTVVGELSHGRVIVTKWMRGTRLDRDASADVPRLCGVAVNAYLTMLLDTGVLHCDPHPGNLLRTPDGRLCVLDWGMTLQVPKDIQYSLLEFIAHVNSEDFDALPYDLVRMGFSSPGKIEQLKQSGIAEGMALTMRQMVKGGGPQQIAAGFKDELKRRYGDDLSQEELNACAQEEFMSRIGISLDGGNLDVNDVTGMVEEMSRRNRDLFSLPPYILYVSRAFAVLEGIGLSIDPEYSIVKECFPYLSKRLLTDGSPRSKNALRAMLMGSERVFSVDKFVEMSDGFSSYTAATASADSGAGLKQAKAALTGIVLQREGNHVQDLLLEGAANTTESLFREGYDRVKHSRIGRVVKTALKTQNAVSRVSVPRPLKPLTIPLAVPYQLAKAMDTLAQKDDDDVQTMKSLKSLRVLINDKMTASSSSAHAASPSGSGSSGASSEPTGSGDSESATNRAPGTPPSRNQRQPVGIFRAVSRQLRGQLSNPESTLRETLRDRDVRRSIPGTVLNISRKFGSSLLQRAADRFERASEPATATTFSAAAAASRPPTMSAPAAAPTGSPLSLSERAAAAAAASAAMYAMKDGSLVAESTSQQLIPSASTTLSSTGNANANVDENVNQSRSTGAPLKLVKRLGQLSAYAARGLATILEPLP